jgi:hypothetical protein
LNLENNNEAIVDIVNSAYICVSVSNAIAKKGVGRISHVQGTKPNADSAFAEYILCAHTTE